MSATAPLPHEPIKQKLQAHIYPRSINIYIAFLCLCEELSLPAVLMGTQKQKHTHTRTHQVLLLRGFEASEAEQRSQNRDTQS